MFMQRNNKISFIFVSVIFSVSFLTSNNLQAREIPQSKLELVQKHDAHHNTRTKKTIPAIHFGPGPGNTAVNTSKKGAKIHFGPGPGNTATNTTKKGAGIHFGPGPGRTVANKGADIHFGPGPGGEKGSSPRNKNAVRKLWPFMLRHDK
jgi:hypothetical protein